jgi:hypothetical protein
VPFVPPPATAIRSLSRAEFAARFGNPQIRGALCGYTREADTRAVLTLLIHARPRRVLEVGTALGHMTANLTCWTPEDACIFTIDIVQGMARAAPGASEQHGEIPGRVDLGRFADHFGHAHKVFFITADTMRYDFGRLAPLEFAFIDGGHDLEHVTNDSREADQALAPGGWLVWHDFDSTVPWVRVSEAIERIGFAEAVVQVEGTEIPFLRRVRPPDAPSDSSDRAAAGDPVTGGGAVRRRGLDAPYDGRATAPPRKPVRLAREGDVQGLHSLEVGEVELAESYWRRILRLKRPDQFCSVDQGIYGHLTLRNLAVGVLSAEC